MCVLEIRTDEGIIKFTDVELKELVTIWALNESVGEDEFFCDGGNGVKTNLTDYYGIDHYALTCVGIAAGGFDYYVINDGHKRIITEIVLNAIILTWYLHIEPYIFNTEDGEDLEEIFDLRNVGKDIIISVGRFKK